MEEFGVPRSSFHLLNRAPFVFIPHHVSNTYPGAHLPLGRVPDPRDSSAADVEVWQPSLYVTPVFANLLKENIL